MSNKTQAVAVGNQQGVLQLLQEKRNLLILGLSVLALLPLWVVRFAPFADYPDWLYQAHIFRELLTNSTSPLKENFSLALTPVPNIGSSLGIGLLSLILPLEIAGKLYLSLYLVGLPLSIIYLFRSVHGKPTSLELCGFAFVYSWFFFLGVSSFLLALPLVFWIIGLVLRQGPTLHLKPAIWLTVLITALYFCHLLGYLMVGVFLVAFLVIVRPAWSTWRTYGLVVVPSLICLFLYTLSSTSAGGLSTEFSFNLFRKAVSFLRPLLPFLRFEPVSLLWPTTLLNLLWLGSLFGIILYSLYQKQKGRPPVILVSKILLVSGLAYLVLVLILPARFSGIVSPEERFSLPALFLLLAAFKAKSSFKIEALLVSLILISLTITTVNYIKANQEITRFHNLYLAVFQTGQNLETLSVRNYPNPLSCAPAWDFGPTSSLWVGTRLANYAMLEMRPAGVSPSIFATGLLKYKETNKPADLNYGDIELGNLATFVNSPTELAKIKASNLVILGCSEDRTKLRTGLSDRYTLVEDSPLYTLLKLKN